MQVAFRFMLSPPSASLPNPPAAASASASSSSYPVATHHGRRRPPEPRCRCGRSPGMASSSGGGSGSGDRDGEASSAACRPVDRDGGASSDRQTGSKAPKYQETSTKEGTSTGDFEGSQKKQYITDGSSNSSSNSSYFKAFGVDLSPDNVAVAIVYFVQGVLGLSRLAISFYLKDDLQLDPAELSMSSMSASNALISEKPFYVNILSLGQCVLAQRLRWFLLSRLQLYLVSQPCHGWSSPFMV